MAQNWAKGGTGKAKTSTKYVKGYAGGGFIEGLASGIVSGYGSGARSGDKKANGPSKLAIKFDDGTTIADNIKSGLSKLKTNLIGEPKPPTAASSTTYKPEE